MKIPLEKINLDLVVDTNHFPAECLVFSTNGDVLLKHSSRNKNLVTGTVLSFQSRSQTSK